MHEKAYLSEFRCLRDISVRKLEPFEDAENGIKIQIHFTTPSTYSYSSMERKSFSQYMALFIPRETTTKLLHSYLFKYLGNAT
jgi:hypothetical protein